MEESEQSWKGKIERLGVADTLANHAAVEELEQLMGNWSRAEIFYKSSDPQIAEKLVQITLCHTYLFGRYTLPSYAGHIFMALRDIPPADDL